LIGRLLRSDTGRILIAIRENELRSELVGYDVRLYKLFAFVVSAAVAGPGGACLVPILLQKSLATLLNNDSVALMRFAVEAIDDGAAQSRPR